MNIFQHVQTMSLKLFWNNFRCGYMWNKMLKFISK